jgi:hypothetical protein
MTIFERVIPFSERLQWLMLKTAFRENVSADLLAKRSGWNLAKVRQIVNGKPGKIRIDDIGVWFFACGGQMPKFSAVSKTGQSFGPF